jgi:hypothetical protein
MMQAQFRMFCEECRFILEEIPSGLTCPKCGAMITNPYTIDLWNQLKQSVPQEPNPVKKEILVHA